MPPRGRPTGINFPALNFSGSCGEKVINGFNENSRRFLSQNKRAMCVEEKAELGFNYRCLLSAGKPLPFG